MMIIDFVRFSVGGYISSIRIQILPEEGIHQDDKEECFDEGDPAELRLDLLEALVLLLHIEAVN